MIPEERPNRSKQRIHSVDMNTNYYVMTCNTEIPSIDNTTKKINLSTTILNEFTSTYYDDKNMVLKFCSNIIQ